MEAPKMNVAQKKYYNKENIDEILHRIEEKLDTNEARQLKIEEHLVKIQTTMDQMIRKNVPVGSKKMFPIDSVENLAEVEKDFKFNFEKNTQILKVIINPGGPLQNFNRIFSNELILSMNYDGLCEKHALKEFKMINKAIFEAVANEGYNQEQYIRDLRTCFRTYKYRILKRKYDKQRQNMTNNKERMICTKYLRSYFRFRKSTSSF